MLGWEGGGTGQGGEGLVGRVVLFGRKKGGKGGKEKNKTNFEGISSYHLTCLAICKIGRDLRKRNVSFSQESNFRM